MSTMMEGKTLTNRRNFVIPYPGVASYGALATAARAPFDFQLFNLSGHFRSALTLTFDFMRFPIH